MFQIHFVVRVIDQLPYLYLAYQMLFVWLTSWLLYLFLRLCTCALIATQAFVILIVVVNLLVALFVPSSLHMCSYRYTSICDTHNGTWTCRVCKEY